MSSTKNVTEPFADLAIRAQDSDSLPIYVQLRDGLRDFIVARGVPDGTLLPDVRSLSVTAGVSVRTMDRALRLLIEEGFCYRRPKKGTFVGRGREAGRKRGVIALYAKLGWTTVRESMVGHHVYEGVEAEALKRGLDLTMVHGAPMDSLARYARSGDFELRGVLLLEWEGLAEVRAMAKRFPALRMVCLNYADPDFDTLPPNVFGVFNDDFAGGYQAGDCLVRHGHRTAAAVTVGPMQDENYAQRVLGFRQAWMDHGLMLRADHILEGRLSPPFDQRALGRGLAAGLLKLDPVPSAVFCVNDLLAAGVAAGMAERGTRADVELIGYDNTVPALSRDGGFSTVTVDFRNMGKRAVAMLLDDDAPPAKVLRLSPRLVLRAPGGEGGAAVGASGSSEDAGKLDVRELV